MGYMTNGLTFNTLRSANITRLAETPKFEKCRSWSEAQWMNAILGELGEAANILKKVDRGDFPIAEARGKLADELADVQTYLDLFADKVGINLGEASMKKWNEISARVGSDIYIEADDWHRSGK